MQGRRQTRLSHRRAVWNRDLWLPRKLLQRLFWRPMQQLSNHENAFQRLRSGRGAPNGRDANRVDCLIIAQTVTCKTGGVATVAPGRSGWGRRKTEGASAHINFGSCMKKMNLPKLEKSR